MKKLSESIVRLSDLILLGSTCPKDTFFSEALLGVAHSPRPAQELATAAVIYPTLRALVPIVKGLEIKEKNNDNSREETR